MLRYLRVGVLVYLEPGPWTGGEPEDDRQTAGVRSADDDGAACQFRQTFAQLLSSGIQESQIVFVTVIESYRRMDVELRAVHCFDRRIRWPRLSSAAIGAVFLEEVGTSVFEESVVSDPARVGAILRFECPDRRRRSLLRQALKRRAWQERRRLGLAELIEFAVYGTADETTHVVQLPERRINAVHEAGHALAIWMGSAARIPPMYCSVMPRANRLGTVVEGYERRDRDFVDASYADAVWEIRVYLAGRAAEHLLLGPDQVSLRGSGSDLERASGLATEMFARHGHASDLSSEEGVAANLAVVLGSPSASECAHVEERVRQLLQRQYLAVLALLRDNSELLGRIVEALVERSVLFKSDFEALMAAESSR